MINSVAYYTDNINLHLQMLLSDVYQPGNCFRFHWEAVSKIKRNHQQQSKCLNRNKELVWRQDGTGGGRGDIKWKPSYIITSCRAPAELAWRPKVATAKANEGSGPAKGIFSLPMASFLKTTHPFPESHGSERSENFPINIRASGVS